MLYDVVIAHATKDQQWAEALCEKLEKKGMRCFLGCRDIPAGRRFSVAALEALAESRMLLVAYTKNYNSTPQMNREVEMATKKDIPVLTIGQADGEELLMEANRYAGWIAALIGQQTKGDDVDENDDDNVDVVPSTLNFQPSTLNSEALGLSKNLQTGYVDRSENLPSIAEPLACSSAISTTVEVPEEHLHYLPHDDDDFVPEDADDMTDDTDPVMADDEADGGLALLPSIEAVDDPNECYRIAEAYYCGKGVAQSYYEAVMWYEKAAKMGHHEAQCDLGNCYYYGEGLPENYERSVYWYEKAAEQGNVRALYNLGNSYYYGEGVTENRELAMAYYDRAACLGSEHAKKRLEELGDD